MENEKRIKSYVLRASRMSKGQQDAYNRYYDQYCIEYCERVVDFSKVFVDKNVYIEIGFGMGRATADIAQEYPDNAYIGIEVHKPGVGRLLYEINERKLKNMKIISHDAVEVLEKMIKPGSVSGFHIFFPDPWPKNKHHKRRLINDVFLKLLVSKLDEKGYIYTVTDWDNYAEQISSVLEEESNLYNSLKAGETLPFRRPQTAFENKGIRKNHKIYEFFYRKR